MTETTAKANSEANKIALDAIQELDDIHKTASEKNGNKVTDGGTSSSSKTERDKKKTKDNDDDAIEEIEVTKQKVFSRAENNAQNKEGDDIIEEGEVTRKKCLSRPEVKSKTNKDDDAIEEIEVIGKGESSTTDNTKRRKCTDDAIEEIEVIDKNGSYNKDKKKRNKGDDDAIEEIAVVNTGESNKPEHKKRKKLGENSSDCQCEFSVAGKQRKEQLDGLQTLLSQQQQTLQSQQLLQQQQYVQQKEFLKQQQEFMKHQKLTMENMDKLLQVLANNAAVWSGLGEAIAPSDQVKQEKVKTESSGGTKCTGEGDDDIAILPTPEKVIETVELDDQDGRNKKNYYNVYRGEDIHDRMPTAGEKRIQEEVTKLLKG